jgi:predicted DNA-binding protein YlxM (UPF0122 family)
MNYERKFYSKVAVLLDYNLSKDEIMDITRYDEETIDKYIARYNGKPRPEPKAKQVTRKPTKAETVVELYKNGKTIKQIREETKQPLYKIYMYLRDADLAFEKVPRENYLTESQKKLKEEMINYFNHGISFVDMAKKYKVSKQAIQERFKKWGYSKNNANAIITQKEADIILELRSKLVEDETILEILTEARSKLIGVECMKLGSMALIKAERKFKIPSLAEFKRKYDRIEKTKIVTELRDKGLNIHEIAFQGGIHVTIVSSILKENGVKLSSGNRLKEYTKRNPIKITDDLVNQVKDLYNSGKTKMYINNTLGLHNALLNKILAM